MTRLRSRSGSGGETRTHNQRINRPFDGNALTWGTTRNGWPERDSRLSVSFRGLQVLSSDAAPMLPEADRPDAKKSNWLTRRGSG